MAVSAEYIQTDTNPFDDQVDGHNYFEDESRAEIAQKIAHLLEFGSDLLFIHGDTESGKSTLIKHLITEKRNQWLCCYTNAEESNSVNSFLTVLAKHFGIIESSPESVLDKLAQQLTDAHQKGQFAVLFVDDADKLDPSLFNLIVSISTIAISGSPVLRIGLIGREVPIKLKELIATSSNNSQMTITEIPPFNEEQTGVYIHHRLAAAGSNQQGTFTPAVINRIYKQSRGQPSHINALAYSRITQTENTKHVEAMKPATGDSSSNNHFVLKIIALALAVAVVVSLFFLRSEEQPPKPNDNVAQRQTTLELPKPETPPQQPIIPPKMIPEPPKAEVQTAAPDTQQTTAITQPVNTPEPAQQTQDKADEAIEVQTPVTAAASDSEWRTEVWIAARAQGHLTLQLIALGSPQAAQNFITKNQLKDQAAYFKTSKNNKIYYSVIYGDYDSRAAAQQAAKLLPTSIGKIKPWIRSFASIQKAVR
jgi:DamX protein